MVGVLILLLIGCAYSAPQANSDLINKLLKGVEKAAEFFGSDYANSNADGVFGLRLGQGQLMQIIEDCEQKHCDKDVLARVRRVTELVEETCEAAMPYLERLDPKYYDQFFPVVKEPYILQYRPHTFRHLDRVEPGQNTDYNEEDGDQCFSRLLGTFVDGTGVKVSKCNTTDHCVHMMHQKGMGEYAITHQLLYFILMEQKGCDNMAGRTVSGQELRRTEEKLCRNIYKEAEGLWEEKVVFVGLQDLFMEQCVLCSILGFENFMRRDWMKGVLSWQAHEGCYKAVTPWENFDEVVVPRTQQEPRQTNMRRLQREAHMSGHCLAHKSGLGFGTLTSFLRYLIRTSSR